MYGNKDGDIMKRKSFGKLAIVAILATLMLFGLCVCSKKADTSATTTTTPAASTTTTTTTTTVATPATTTTTTTVVEEKPAVEEVKVEEPVVEEPVVVETVVEEPVAETVVVEPVVEEPVVVAPEYSTVFSYNGITATIDAYSDHAFISIPEGVTADDIAAVAKLLVSAYPESSDVTYEIKDGNLCLYYPEQAVAYIKAAVSTLSSDAKWLIDILAVEEEPVEEAVAEETTEAVEAPLFSTSFDSDGIKSSIVVYSDHAYLTIPEGVTEQDIVDAAAALVEAYPEYANDCTYAIENGVLCLTYPALTAEELAAYCDELAVEAVAYIDALVEEVVEIVEEQIAATSFDILEDGTVIATYEYDGVKASVVMGDTETVITYPSQYVTKDDILGYINAMVAAVPSLAENVYYAFEGDDTVIFYYPAEYMGGTYYKLETLVAAEDDVTSYINAQLAGEVAVAETPAEPAPAVEEPVAATPAVVAPVEPVAPAPVAAKESFIQSYSVAGAFGMGYNLQSKGLSLGGSLRAEAALSDKLGFGLKVGYDFKNKVLPVSLYGKYTFAEFGGVNVYGAVGLGVDVSTSGKGVGFAAEGTVGLEYAFTENFAAFAEANVKYSFLSKVSFGGAVGGKITF